MKGPPSATMAGTPSLSQVTQGHPGRPEATLALISEGALLPAKKTPNLDEILCRNFVPVVFPAKPRILWDWNTQPSRGYIYLSHFSAST